MNQGRRWSVLIHPSSFILHPSKVRTVCSGNDSVKTHAKTIIKWLKSRARHLTGEKRTATIIGDETRQRQEFLPTPSRDLWTDAAQGASYLIPAGEGDLH